MPLRPRSSVAFLLLAIAVGCGDPMGPVDPMPDGGAEQCASDPECSDGVFCNGAERCAPDDPAADARGCAAALGPACAAGETCVESSDSCREACGAVTDADGDGVASMACGGLDCDDDDAARHPGATEICDGDDEDCDPRTLGSDRDGDGFVDATCCNPSASGGTTCGDDCDDTLMGVNPGTPEACNGVDDDCSGVVDDVMGTRTYYQDSDGDGFGVDTAPMTASCPPDGYTAERGDCDDATASTYPGAAEACNGIDDNCDGMLDGAEDGDGDGFASLSCGGTDCDDARAATHVGATEVCNGIDDDCSSGGGADASEDPDGDGHAPASLTVCTGGFPADDCDETRASAHQGAVELCNRIDDDCSSGGGADASEDVDGDGFAPIGAACAGGTLPRTDCNDTAAAVSPAALEACNGVDDDCSAATPEALARLASCGADAICSADARCGYPPISLDVGAGRACAVLPTGAIACWPAGGAPAIVPGIAGAIAVSVSQSHACAVLAGGGVRCWGANGSGQLGNGSTAGSATPVAVTGITTAVAVATGADASCAVLSSGAIRCWGADDVGQLGNDAAYAGSTSPVAVAGISTARSLALTERHACAVLADGTARCWGQNYDGTLGNGSFTHSGTPVVVSGLSGITQIVVGLNMSCAIASGNLSCWGDATQGQYGPSTPIGSGTPVAIPEGVGARAASAGSLHVCIVRPDRSVRCWGGDPPLTVGGVTPASALSNDNGYGCAVVDPGSIRCWGSSGLPATIGGLGGATAIAAGDAFSCALTTDGRVRCVGGAPAGGTAPVTIALPGGVAAQAVAGGGTHACALGRDSRVYCWGTGANGRLGNGGTGSSATPVQVTGLTDAIAITAGAAHTCALRSGGGVRCWGAGADGRLGNGAFSDALTPVDVSGLSGVVAIDAGTAFTCAVLTGGGAQCWGDGDNGTLGDGGAGDRATPGPVAFQTDAVAIAAGRYHACLVRSGGGVRCWGNNDTGQLGDGSINPSSVAVDTSALTDAVAIDAGAFFTCVTRRSGAVSCWGFDDQGQLGNGGPSSYSLVPTDVTGLSLPAYPAATTRLALGATHACALLGPWDARCWGANGSGQLGTGNTAGATTPVSFVGP